MCPSKVQLHGKTVVITGANSGIGKEAAFELARRKARVVLACQNLQSAKEIVQQIQAATNNSEVVAKELNLASLKSVRQFCQQILSEEAHIDVLINNAGVFQCPYMKTEDGFEMQMGVNHFGHFALTCLLLERIKASAPSRIIVVASSLSKRGSINFEDIHSEKSYSKSKAYADSKLANLLFARELSEKVKNSGVDVIALHPGMILTNLGRHIMPGFITKCLWIPAFMLGLRTPSEGCQVLVYCSVADELKGQSGIYVGKNFEKCAFPPNAVDDNVARKFWKLSEDLTHSK